MTVTFTPPPLIPPNTLIQWPHLPSKAQDHILPSPLCPHVLAGHCFLTWPTPFGIFLMNDEITTFHNHVIACCHVIMSQSVNKETLSNYSAGLICFTKFCDEFSIPDICCMPYSEMLLATFITHCGAGLVGPSTLKSWLLGLELWHNINGAPRYGA